MLVCKKGVSGDAGRARYFSIFASSLTNLFVGQAFSLSPF